MKLLESSIERKVVKWCKAHDVLTTKQGGQGHRGKPDRAFWISGGRPILAEFKRPGGTVTKLQQHVARQFEALGYTVYIFYSAAQAIETLKRYIEVEVV